MYHRIKFLIAFAFFIIMIAYLSNGNAPQPWMILVPSGILALEYLIDLFIIKFYYENNIEFKETNDDDHQDT